MTERALILASSSPQRKALLQQIGFDPECMPADIDETRHVGETAFDYVRRLSFEKCQVVADAYPDAVVIGSDTTISIDDLVLGKADSLEQAIETLSRLSGTEHSVLTGVTVSTGGKPKSVVCETRVEFGLLTDSEIRAYWNSGEAQGKAGCYAIQGIGATFVKAIHGSYSNVVGLPLHEVAVLLKHFGMPVLSGSDTAS